eukprot:TRINITY_DN67456_c12_g2_i1.p1 TRINITY_DN67456_c12_g2~~TRINITY_DN67456_c12_g2_i1.p1  ORF type:complete len:653 (-),score=129.82 TRINITY_DN67456_c12_g2_i1:118-2076(-)
MSTTTMSSTVGTTLTSVKIRWGNEIRRVGVNQMLSFSPEKEESEWSSFIQRIQILFKKAPPSSSASFQYLDNDGDLVTFSSMSELEEAVRTQAILTTTLNIIVTEPTTTPGGAPQAGTATNSTCGRQAAGGAGACRAFGPFVFCPAATVGGGAPRPPAATVVGRCNSQPQPIIDCGPHHRRDSPQHHHPHHRHSRCGGGFGRTLFGGDLQAIIDRHIQTDDELKEFVCLVREAVRTERQNQHHARPSPAMWFGRHHAAGGRGGWTKRILANENIRQPLISYLQQHPNCTDKLEPLLVDVFKQFAQKNLPFLPVGDMVNRAVCSLLEAATKQQQLKDKPPTTSSSLSSGSEILLAVAQTVCRAGLSVTPRHPVVLYNAACCESLMNNTTQALTFLNAAFSNGYCNWEHASSDSDLENVRKTDEFHALLAAHRQSATPSSSDDTEIPVNKPENNNDTPPRGCMAANDPEISSGIGSLLESVAANRTLPVGPDVDNIVALFHSLLGGGSLDQQPKGEEEEGQQHQQQHPFISFVKSLQQVAHEQEEGEQQALFNSFVATPSQTPTSPPSSATTTTTSSLSTVGADTTVLSAQQEEEVVVEEEPIAIEEQEQAVAVSPQVVQLQAMGFDLPVQQLEQLLATHSGDLQRCVNALLLV